MYLLNLTTSLLFGLTSAYTYYMNVIPFFVACGCCLMTSVLYYGSCLLQIDEDLSNSLKIIDIIICNFSVFYCGIIGFSYGFNIWSTLCMLCIIYIIIVYYFLHLSHHPEYGYYIHSSIHIIGNIGVYCLLQSVLLSTII